ncbi:MAG: asparagine--tRNA ligase [Sedimentisphaerales bacterium]|nr:asparagine--tRNA ligase [Sedimentisphaerales bacterium]
MSDQTIRISQMKDHVGQEVAINGWLYHSRAGGKVQFLVVRDGSGMCQAVMEKTDANAERFDQLKHLGQESSLQVRGTVRAEERSVGGYELALSDARIVHATEGYPITPKEHGTDFLLKHRHLHLRSRRQWALARLRHTVIEAIRDFFNDNGFTLVDTPIFAPAAGEGEQTLFQVDYFGQPVALAQTGQLYLEAAALSLGRVYCFGPTFRAEKSKTRRHLTEFWMVEPEIAYIDLDGLLEVAEQFICSIVQAVLAKCIPELDILDRDPAELEKIAPPFVRLSYSEAVDLLHSEAVRDFLDRQLEEKKAQAAAREQEIAQWSEQLPAAKKQWQKDKLTQQIQTAREEIGELTEQIGNIPHHRELAAGFEWGKDLGGSDETIISQLHEKPTFVHRYPTQAKAFYMKPDPQDPRVVLNFDLLAPQGYGEIIGGSMRQDDYQALVERIRQMDYDQGDYEWYLDLRRYGSVPHGGFGLGVERTVAWLAGIQHIRETIAFPRLMGKIYP